MLPFNKPTLLLNKAKCLANIQFMVEKAQKLGLVLRPHFKTHQSLEVGGWFRALGVTRIAVSSVPMAQYFASDGWKDILLAIPPSPSQFEHINLLSNEVKLTLITSTVKGAMQLAQHVTGKVNVMVEIDTGQERSGFKPLDHKQIADAIDYVNSRNSLSFSGFLTHAGHSYKVMPLEIEILNGQAIGVLEELKRRWATHYPNLMVSYGDTPTSTLASAFRGVDELRPGNFVLFDMQQASHGVCDVESIAVALACQVIAVYPNENRAIIWGGAVHLSKDTYIQQSGEVSFGAVCRLNNDNTWTNPIENVFLQSVSQEHGVIKGSNSAFFQCLQEGEWLAILPAHSCLAVSCMGEIYCADDKKVFKCHS